MYAEQSEAGQFLDWKKYQEVLNWGDLQSYIIVMTWMFLFQV